MNIRKNIDYSGLYAEIDKVLAAGLSQMELYLELGRLVSGRPEKGAAVMAAEYIIASYPDRTGFSPRSLRRMRDFYRMYESHPVTLAQAMKIGWTQNIVILEAGLDMDARLWYLRAVQRFGWSKAELIKQLADNAHLEAGKTEDDLDTGCESAHKMLPFGAKPILSFVGIAIAFIEKSWYNRPWQLPKFRQFGGNGEAYG